MGQRSGYTSSGNSGMDKAKKFEQAVEANGWQCQVTFNAKDIVTHLFARRGENETINIWWVGERGAIVREKLPVYNLAGEPIICHNVSAAISIAQKPADMKRLTKAVKRDRKRTSPSRAQAPCVAVPSDEPVADEPTREAARVPLSHDPVLVQGAPDALVAATLLGNGIEWINGQSGLLEYANVSRIEKIVRNGRDHICFTDKRGFHAVYLDAIVAVH